ncbi:MAG: DUF2062 domain-containing protein [Nitrospira sp.]|nr:DUF2062 domain-containing protein [Nitrospira sp.]
MMTVNKPSSVLPPRSFRALLRQVLRLEEPPERTALAFAVGVFIAFCPAYGLHTAMALLCAWLFGLNVVALLAGAFVNNPWTIVPILGATYWTGAQLLGQTETPPLRWDDLSLVGIYTQVAPYLIPFIVGGMVLSLIGAFIAYPLAYTLIIRYRSVPQRESTPSLPPSDQLR